MLERVVSGADGGRVEQTTQDFQGSLSLGAPRQAADDAPGCGVCVALGVKRHHEINTFI